MKTETKTHGSNGTGVIPEVVERQEVVTITAPKFDMFHIRLIGNAPYVQLRFSAKAINAMKEKHKLGSQAKKGKTREARNFEDDYQQAFHKSTEGWYGIPASAFRLALIDACRLVNFKMTLAKLGVFIVADGIDVVDGTPLVKINGTPEQVEHFVRNATGVADIRVRAMWRKWNVDLNINYDRDMFSKTDIANLLLRVGTQVGIGEGRPNGKSSAGMGWGTFTLDAPHA